MILVVYVNFNSITFYGSYLTNLKRVLLFCRCGARQSGDLSYSNEEALDGILGFGKANYSMISQLSSSGKVKKMFAHCLNGVNGGGIFAIGHVVQPTVNTTPLLPDQYAFVYYTSE